jgi:hypothetical protein
MTRDEATESLQALYDSEINFVIATFWDCGFIWRLGDDFNGFKAQGTAKTMVGVAEALQAAAIEYFPNSAFAAAQLARP